MIRWMTGIALENIAVAITLISAIVFAGSMLVAAVLYVPPALLELARAYLSALAADPLETLAVSGFVGMGVGIMLLIATAPEPGGDA